MIFSTLNQLNCFLIFIFFGIIFGVIANIFFIVFLKKYQKNIIKVVFDAIFYSIFAILFVFLINIFNLGNFSLTLLSALILGFFITQKVCGNLVVFFQNKWYNILTKLKSRRENEKKQSKN